MAVLPTPPSGAPGSHQAGASTDTGDQVRTPDAQIPRRVVDQFAKLPASGVLPFIRQLPQNQLEPLAAAFDQRPVSKGNDRLTFQDRRYQAMNAEENARRPPEQRIAGMRVAYREGAGTSIAIRTADGAQHAVPLQLPSGYRVSVNADSNTLVLTRTDGRLMRQPSDRPDAAPTLDHIVLAPGFGPNGVHFDYHAGNASSIMTDLNAYLRAQDR
jgi:hypothetical protein